MFDPTLFLSFLGALVARDVAHIALSFVVAQKEARRHKEMEQHINAMMAVCWEVVYRWS